MRDKTPDRPFMPAPPSRTEFAGVAEAHRRVLKLHCYRNLGAGGQRLGACQLDHLARRGWR